MALRVTQQYVDVLSDGDAGKLRVTQFYVEVLGTQGAQVDVADTLGITDAATETTVGGGTSVSASNALAFTDSAVVATDFSRAVSDAMAIVDTAVAINDIPVDASSALALTDTVNRTVELVAANALAFTDAALPGLYDLIVIDTMTLSDVAESSIKELTVANALAFTDEALAPSFQHVNQALTLTDVASQRIKQVSASSALAFTQSASVVVIHHGSNSLAFTDSVTRHVTFARHTADALDFTQTVTIFIDRDGVTCVYSPFVGTGPLTISTTPPTLTPTTLQLFWPVVSPTLTVDLRNADFGNKIGYNQNRIYRKSRGGTQILFRKPSWPKFVLIQMDLSLLDDTQINSFKSFLNQTLGLEIGIRDHDGILWKGIITTPDTDITQTGGRVCAEYATSFQFEGELIS